MEKITLPGKPEWDMETEVLVVGGGPAGVCAAIAAAREGVKVLLIEKGGFSGGKTCRENCGGFKISRKSYCFKKSIAAA